MKFSAAAAAVLAATLPAVSARFADKNDAGNVVLYPNKAEAESYLIELAPGKTRWVTEEEKWELRRDGQRFMDLTYTPDLGSKQLHARAPVEFPAKCQQQEAVKGLIPSLSKDEMHRNLEKLTSFHTRYYKSDHGRDSSDWLFGRIGEVIAGAGAEDTVSVRKFEHPWPQTSTIVTIPGRTNSTVVIGAHQDSINLWFPSVLPAPGADDDGSGTVTILEVLRVLLQDEDVVAGRAQNTIEFHWYSAEEGGLLGSQAIFKEYEKQARDVKAMLQQDMTGYSQKTIDSGKPESVGVIVDFVDPGLTTFIKTTVDTYCEIPYVETKCGYACSDHASASKAGYPSAFVIESSFDLSSPHIHGTGDTIDTLNFDHMLQHARLTLGFVYELAAYTFGPTEARNNEL
ncbi:related to aminopeptidase [Cephalotrichum gorgonifer]|uniref:Peptide hydrolase n=1 Tax=Cephalotrichum gorgonifer TaxID=2041049 RepID=A0AAE8STS0_9PEZI|nr:related to aminopeptidase [Cephalotrichum gorgonifer]